MKTPLLPAFLCFLGVAFAQAPDLDAPPHRPAETPATDIAPAPSDDGKPRGNEEGRQPPANENKNAEPDAPDEPTPPSPSINDLSAGEIAAVIERLRAATELNSVINEDLLERARLEGLLARHGEIVWKAGQPAKSEIRVEALFHRFSGALYLGSGPLDRDGARALAEALALFRAARETEPNLPVILDFRTAVTDPEPHLAASFASPFFPRGTLLFTFQELAGQPVREFRSAGGPPSDGVCMILLVDSDVSGAAEIVAARLKGLEKVIVIGEKTSGRGGRLGRLAARPGFELEFRRGRYAPPTDDGETPIATTPVAVDIEAPLSADAKRELLKRLASGGAGSLEAVVKETGRERFNEASLVAGVNPEFANLDTFSGKGPRNRPFERAADPALKAALDLIEAMRVQEADPVRREQRRPPERAE